MNKIRVFVVDDSAYMRKMISMMLSSDPGIEVAGTAMDGIFALKKIKDLKPDVITLDINMPRMDGIETLNNIVRDFQVPVIIVSSATKKDAELSLQALESGAFDFVTKPQTSSLDIHKIRQELIEKVKGAHQNPQVNMKVKQVQSSSGSFKKKSTATGISAEKVLAIGVSTGGPNALSYLLPQLPPDFPAAIVIVQHMPISFTGTFAARLNSICNIDVKEAEEGDLLIPGRALIAPGDKHLEVKRMHLSTVSVISDSPYVNGHKPSADVLFRSVASEYGENTTGLIMTGMGNDGAEGIGDIKAKGGLTVAQDEKSCVVFGMPGEAIRKNNIKNILPLEDMGGFLINHFTGKEELYGTVECLRM